MSAEELVGESSGDAAPYPPSWEADVVLRDGHTVRVRPMLPSDAERLVRFHERQSPESVYFRFFSPRPSLSAKEVTYFTHLDLVDRVAFVAILDEEIVGVARYERYAGTDTAEVAFFVDDEHNGRGLATVMLEYLVAAARQRGITRFTASTLPNNRRMLAVFGAAGFDVTSKLDSGVIDVSFDIHPTDESVRLAEERRLVAEAASVHRLLAPASVVVIGTDAEDGLGAEMLRSIAAHGYRGSLHAVTRGGRSAEDLGGVEVATEVPDGVDLAVIALPAAEVPAVVEDCGRRGVGAVVILSAGFAERGPGGAALQSEVLASARRHGIRVLGPNCLGLVNTDPEVSLHATVAPGTPPQGTIGILAESGTLAAAIIDQAERRQLGLSTFVAAGNPADVGAADMLSYWSTDESTEAVLLYLRSSGLPPRLVSTARLASLRKPVAVLGSVLSASPSVDGTEAARRIEALARQTGVINVGTMEQLFDVGRLLSCQPLPRGNGVAVVGNSDGAVAIAADACRASGLEVVDLSGGSRGAHLMNPLDLSWRATAEDYRLALAALRSRPEVHNVLVVHTPPRLRPTADVVDVVVAASAASPYVTFAATLMDTADVAVVGEEHRVPVFAFPEHAARSMGRLAAYREWRDVASVAGRSGPVGADPDRAGAVVTGALGRSVGGSRVALDLREQEELLGAFGVELAARRVVDGVDRAAEVAAELGYPVAVKAATRDRTSRAARSGVVVDIADEDALRSAWSRVSEALGDGMYPAVIQRFIDRGVDTRVRLRRLGNGTATVEVGLGGPVSSFDEPRLGVLPLTLADAQWLVATSSLGRALSDPLDRVPIVGVVQRLAWMFDMLEELVELDADPVVASGGGAWVADVAVQVRPAQPELAVRRLG